MMVLGSLANGIAFVLEMIIHMVEVMVKDRSLKYQLMLGILFLNENIQKIKK